METPQALLDELHGIGIHSLNQTSTAPDTSATLNHVMSRFCIAKDNLIESRDAIKSIYNAQNIVQREQIHLELAPYNLIEQVYTRVERALEQATVSAQSGKVEPLYLELPRIVLHKPGDWAVTSTQDALNYVHHQVEIAQVKYDQVNDSQKSFPDWLIGVLVAGFALTAYMLWYSNGQKTDLLSIVYYVVAGLAALFFAVRYCRDRNRRRLEAGNDLQHWQSELKRIEQYV